MVQVTEWLDGFQRRHRWASFPLGVVYKFFEDQGPYLAALITYYGFLSMFPLLLLSSSVLGFVLQDNPDLQQRILDSALSQFPIIGEELSDPEALRGSVAAVLVGAVVAIYGTLGVAQALQHAMNVAWSIPRHHRPNPFRARLRSLLLVATAGVAVVTTTILSVLAGSTEDGQMFAGPLAILAVVAAFAINAAVFVAVFRISAATTLSIRAVLPGAVIGALIWQLVQIFGTVYARTVVANASATYGVFALVLGLMAWIFLATSGVVLGVEVNVVRAKHLYPRALLTLFTDNVDLTGADRRAYTDAVIAQRHKAFQSIEVDFEDEGQQATARKLAAQAHRPPAGGEQRGVAPPASPTTSASVAECDDDTATGNEDTTR